MNYNIITNLFDRKNINFIIFASCIYLLIQPYFVWDIERLQIILFFPLILISFLYVKKITNKDIIILMLFVYIYVYMAGGRNIFGYINSLFFLTFLIIKEKLIVNAFYWFKLFFVSGLVLSLIVYIMVLFFTVPISFNIIKPLNQLKLNDYVQYPFLVSEGVLSFSRINVRFNGMFDEPGVIGSVAVILLFADKFNLKSKQNIVLLIAGIFSLSLYFIVSSLIYFLIFTKNKIKFIFAFIVILFYLSTMNNSTITLLVWDRFTFEGSKFKGDNRSNAWLDEAFYKLFKSEDLLWGKGFYSIQKTELMGASSYKSLFVGYGVVFVGILLLTFYLLAYINIKDKKLLAVYLFMFVGMMYQRPGMLYFPGSFFLLIASIYVIKNNQVVTYSIPIDNRLILSSKNVK